MVVGRQLMQMKMSEACSSCANFSLVEAMLSYLAQTDCYFGGSQRDSESLSVHDKVQYLHSTLHQSVSTFITRYGSKLTPVHVGYFTENFSDEDIMYQLALLKKDQLQQGQRIKNRRFTAMKNLMSEGDYFSDEQMKHRDPLLYEQMIGQHLSEDEIKSQSDNLLREHTGLSTVLLEQMDSKDNTAEYDRQVSRQESQLEEGDSDEDELFEDEEGEKLVGEEKKALKEEFVHIMQERFMAGMDSDFNYEAVDGNDAYDDIVQEMRDEEEKYFDGSEEDVCETGPSPLAADEYDY